MKIQSVDALRGIAALWVVWFHFVYGNASIRLDDQYLYNFFYLMTSRGSLGVQIFFVISGFILPWSLLNSNYDLKNYHRFLLKRIIRLEPPYFICILIIILLGFLSTLHPLYRGDDFKLQPVSLFLHLGYLNAFFDYSWLNPVFWTLAIEFQYYLILGLVFSFFLRFSQLWLVLGLLVFSQLSLFRFPESVLLAHTIVFAIGFATFLYKANKISSHSFLVLLLIWGVELAVVHDVVFSVICVSAALFILFFKYRLPVLSQVGLFSYSIYLLHVPIGQKIINLASNFANNDFQRLGVYLLAISTTLGVAFLFYWFIEKPCQKISKNIRYKKHSGIDERNSHLALSSATEYSQEMR